MILIFFWGYWKNPTSCVFDVRVESVISNYSKQRGYELSTEQKINLFIIVALCKPFVDFCLTSYL